MITTVSRPLVTSAEYFDLVFFYCGRPPPLPPDLCMLMLEFAGLCGRGRTCSYFWVYN